MRKKDKEPTSQDRRKQAETLLTARVAEGGQSAAITPEEALRLVHELQVHQIELEMQNEELRRAEEELRLSRDRYSSLYDFAPVGYVTLDAQGAMVKANLMIARMLGVERGRLLDQTLARYVAADARSAFEAYIQAARQSEVRVPLDATLVRADGTTFPVHMDGLALEVPDGPPQLRLSISDVSVLQATMDALRQSEEHFRTLVQHIPDVTWTVDERGRLTYISPNVERLTGFTAAEILESKPDFWEERIEPADLDAALQAFQGLAKGRDIYEVEYRFRHKSGEQIWIQSRSVRTFEVNGKQRTDGILSDVTIRKRVEEALHQAARDVERQSLERATQIRQLEQQRDAMTEEVTAGRVAATVIHEINNPLAGILNSFRLIRKGISPDHPYYQFLELINRELERLAQLVRKMYGYGQPVTEVNAQCDPNRVLDDVLMVMAADVESRRIKVRVDVSSKATVKISESALKQVLYNLYTNALKASQEGSEIGFAIQQSGGMVHIAVQDHGSGIPAHILPHIFDSFTDGIAARREKGMHVGLSTSRTLVEGANGTLELSTAEGKGTTVVVQLPAAQTVEQQP
ncbi:MAG TPA: PAS domain S-box protein [bacterium]